MTDQSAEFGEHHDGMLHLHSLYSRFESEWQTGPRPQIASFLHDVEPSRRAALLELLIPADIRCRQLRGEHPVAEDYAAFADVVTDAGLRSLVASVISGDTETAEHSTDHTAAPTPVLSADEFLSRLRDSQIVDHDSLPPEADGKDAADIGEQLIESGLLTRFQLNALVTPSDLPLRLGDYVLLDQIGQGGMGTVFRARHRRMKRVVAIKILRRQTSLDTDSEKRFAREVELAAQLSHPNVVTAYDAGEQDGLQFLVTEFVDGENLADMVRQGGPLPLTDSLQVIHQAAQGLQYAHSKGIIHRDIKPANLLLDTEGTVKLLDVGLARLIHDSNSPARPDEYDLTGSGVIMGTIDYMSPEQAHDTHEADEQSDLYSLGCTLWFLLTGRAPFAEGTVMQRLLAHRERPVPSLKELHPQVPPQLDEFCQRALAKRPTDRPASAAEFAEQVDLLLQSDMPDLTLVSDHAADVESTVLQTPIFPPDADRQQPESATVVTPDSDAGGRPIVRPRRGPAPLTALLSVVLPGLAAVALVVWWFGSRSPDSSGPGVALSRDTGSLPQLTNASEQDVIAWRARWAESHDHAVTAELHEIDFVLIPPGRFVMGEEESGSVVETADGFYLSATEITVGQFREFVQSTGHTTAERGWGWNGNHWELRAGWGWERPGLHEITEQHPAASIRFSDAEAYCDWLSQQTGRWVRLPTEAEWEYACRCGRAGRWSFGNDPEAADDYAWTQRQSGSQLHRTAGLQPNAWGLYDMHGNESEWCVPAAGEVAASQAVVRGGGFNSVVMETTSASRLIQERTDPSHGAFRIVLEPE